MTTEAKDKTMKTRRKFHLNTGNILTSETERRTIELNGNGKGLYIWIGGRGCYGHISGPKTLESLAHSILEALNRKP